MAKAKSSSRSSSSRSTARGGSSSRSTSARRAAGGAAVNTSDHEKIRNWVEERGGKPACVKGTEGGKSCLLRIDFPGGAGEESLKKMSSDDFFDVLDSRGLVFLHQKGNSTFNKIVTPDSVRQRAGKSRPGASGSAKSKGRSAGSGGKNSGASRHGRGSR